MKKTAVLLFSGLLWAAGALPLIPLPENAAAVDGVNIPSSAIAAQWNKILAELPDDTLPESLERIYRSLTEQYIWQREIQKMLAESGQKVNRDTAEKFFKLQQKKYPLNIGKIPPETLDQLFDSQRFQLKSAIHFHLDATVPEKIRITHAEVENLYRSMPGKFRISGRENWKIIEVQDRKSAESVRALLLQGSAFESAAKRFSPPEIKSPLPRELTRKGPAMKVKEISPVIKSENGWIVAQLHSRSKSTVLPLEKVYPQLARELEAAKESAALTQILKRRLSQKKIIYIPLKQKNQH